MNGGPGALVVIPTLRGGWEGGRVRVTAKFVEGMLKYVELWGGPVVALVRHSDVADKNLDPVAIDAEGMPFRVERVDFADPAGMAAAIARAGGAGRTAVVLASLDWEQLGMVDICGRVGVPCVYACEYSVRTRREIIRATTPSLIRRLRRYLWTNRLETRQVAAIRAAAGVQCNGTPTWDAYRDVSPSPLLYFDTRVVASMVAAAVDLASRAARLRAGGPLRLAFSGRLARMKGAHQLVAIAAALREQTPFTLEVFGDGECRQEMERDIQQRGLGGVVVMRGVVPFGELMSHLRLEIDLAVLPHPQGDPACTYLETLAAGVPVVGYANEAWTGILREAGHAVGTAVPMGDVRAAAAAMALLGRDRERLVALGENAVAFAGQHTFEGTFARRISHLRRIADQGGVAGRTM